MSQISNLKDSALILLMNQLREEYLEREIDPNDFEEIINYWHIIPEKTQYFGIKNIDVEDITFVYDFFLSIDDLDEEITELPKRPQLKTFEVMWEESVTEYKEYTYRDTVDSYCNLTPAMLEILRYEDFFDPWSGKLIHSDIVDSETTDDKCSDVKEI